MSIKNILAILDIEFKSARRNKKILMLFILFPIFGYIIYFIMGEASKTLIPLVMTLSISLSPVLCLSTMMAEEKEKNVLRSLIMNNVKPLEYLIGISTIIFIMSVLSACTYLPIIDVKIANFGQFIITTSLGAICSILLGAISGVFIDSVANASFTSSPVSLVLCIIPMLAPYNEVINKLSNIVYSGIISRMISSFSTQFTLERCFIIIANIFVLFLIFCLIYNKKGLAEE